MIKQNLDQIIHLINHHEIHYIIFHEGIHDEINIESSCFSKIHEEDHKEVIKKLKEFASFYPNEFTIQMANRQSDTTKHRILTRVDFAPVKQATTQEIPTQPQQLNGDDYRNLHKEIREEIREEIRATEQVNAERREKEILQGRVMELETMGGKFAFAVTEIIKQVAPDMMGNFAGAPNPMQGDAPQDLDQAFDKLRDLLGDDDIIKLAGKLQPGDPLINMVKQYANS